MTGQLDARGIAAINKGYADLGIQQGLAGGIGRRPTTEEVIYRIATMTAVIFLLATVV
jgi:hypothetical protein